MTYFQQEPEEDISKEEEDAAVSFRLTFSLLDQCPYYYSTF
jgi:hypothetical protein